MKYFLASDTCNPCPEKRRLIKRIKHGLSSGYHREIIRIITATRAPLQPPTTTPSAQFVLPPQTST